LCRCEKGAEIYKAQKELPEIINPNSKGSPTAGYDREGVEHFCGKTSDWNQRMPSNVSFDVKKAQKKSAPTIKRIYVYGTV
jgi:hypothetical protein